MFFLVNAGYLCYTVFGFLEETFIVMFVKSGFNSHSFVLLIYIRICNRIINESGLFTLKSLIVTIKTPREGREWRTIKLLL